MVLDSDAHEPDDLLTPELTRKIAAGAGLTDEEARAVLQLNPQKLLAKLGLSPMPVSQSQSAAS